MVNSTTKAIISLATLALLGCGSEESTKEPLDARALEIQQKSLNGIYIGTLGEAAGSSHFSTAIVQDGRIMAYSPDKSRLYDGYLLAEDAEFLNGELSAYEGSQLKRASTMQVEGAYDPENFISAALRSTAGQGEADLTYNTKPGEMSFQQLVDTWADSQFNSAFNIDERGAVDGTDNSACVYRGFLSHPAATQAAYLASIEISNCGERDGFYDGFAFIDPSSQYNKRLNLLLSNDEHGRIFTLDRRGVPTPALPSAPSTKP